MMGSMGLQARRRLGALSGSLKLATSPVPGEVEFSALCATQTGSAASAFAWRFAGRTYVAPTAPLPVRA